MKPPSVSRKLFPSCRVGICKDGQYGSQMGYLHKDVAPLFMIIVPYYTCKEPFLQKCFYFTRSKERCPAPQEVIGNLQRKLLIPCLLSCCSPFITWISFSNNENSVGNENLLLALSKIQFSKSLKRMLNSAQSHFQ